MPGAALTAVSVASALAAAAAFVALWRDTEWPRPRPPRLPPARLARGVSARARARDLACAAARVAAYVVRGVQVSLAASALGLCVFWLGAHVLPLLLRSP
jgi:hypothetical protein